MLKKCNIERVLEIFFLKPTTPFTIRQLAKEVDLAPPTALRIVRALQKEGLIREQIVGRASQITANLENPTYIWKKRAYNLDSLYSNGLVGYLVKNYQDPLAIILFGSYARGEDIERSDIDIAIFTTEHKPLDLKAFEKALCRIINVHEVQLDQVSDEFKNNLYNGIVLHGAV
ncbi:MAG TPA: nucleotidyltransferase domain-containing protein [Candidatus Nanoarchaeia archaeon]|nr:nucleotidyltransferase domain-containing protein [Candidatus Nanoarchaeia archaeon]